ARPGRWAPDAADPAGGCAADAAPADARRVLLLHATQAGAHGICSRIVWSCPDATEPPQRRDIVVTEYGVADLRGQSDRVVVERLVAVADSRFQDELVQQARAHGVLPADYTVPERHRHNLPQVIERRLRPWMQAGLLPARPFGSDALEDAPSAQCVPPPEAGHGGAALGGGRQRAAQAGADDDGPRCRPGTAAGERSTPAVPRHALLPAGGGAVMQLG
ncbi:MAG: hypothetical protein JSR43_05990, partial [Proteobacteria bacterium]|nr:hypothetical protein [Pseudomonadota bacterium]